MTKSQNSQRDISKSLAFKPAALKLKDACIYLGGVAPITVRRLINRGLIKPNRALRHIVIPIAELDRFLVAPTTESRK